MRGSSPPGGARGLGACPGNGNGRVRDAVGPDARRCDATMGIHRQGAATKQTAPRRLNPEGTGGLRPDAALLVVSDGNPSLPPRALPEAASPLCAALAIS